MSLTSDLDDLFGDDEETIINEPLRFKANPRASDSARARVASCQGDSLE